MKLLVQITSFAVVTIIATGCMMTAAEHSQSLHSEKEREFTLGNVQRHVYRGMSQADVAEALGSPNIVSQDDQGDETWIYDKIASEASYSTDRGSSAGGVGAGGPAGSVLILGGLFGSYDRSAGASARTQKTLTVVIKFDKKKRVKDFSYHSSKF